MLLGGEIEDALDSAVFVGTQEEPDPAERRPGSPRMRRQSIIARFVYNGWAFLIWGTDGPSRPKSRQVAAVYRARDGHRVIRTRAWIQTWTLPRIVPPSPSSPGAARRGGAS